MSRIEELFGLRGRVALVTGGSSGIGTMIAQALLDAGATVAICSRKAALCHDVAAELSSRGTCIAVPGDVSTTDGVRHVAAELGARFDRLDVLVNNAGATWGAELEAYPRAAWDKVLGVNLIGPFELTVAVLDLLRAGATEDRPARVINVGSINGASPPRMESYAYSTSKAAVHMLTRHLAARLAPEHITVNTLAPGPFESRMMAFAMEDEQAMAALVGDIPLQRIGRPDDIAAAALYLAGSGASWVTGTTLSVDGGATGCA
jgi:NAD(P)-dependent dehydrogenase (short-subunit alcohol dehydrogenase family)